MEVLRLRALGRKPRGLRQIWSIMPREPSKLSTPEALPVFATG